MNRSLFPPCGIFVPTHMIFNTQLPSAVLVTWIQLRCLAWRGWATPPLSIPELASLIGIHTARLQRHLAQLQDLSALVCRNAGEGKLILSFPEEPTPKSKNQPASTDLSYAAMHNTRDQETPASASYFPTRILGYLSYQDDQEPVEITNDLEELHIGLEKVENCY